jgi:hypothetical protein
MKRRFWIGHAILWTVVAVVTVFFLVLPVPHNLKFGVQSTQTGFVGVNCYLGSSSSGSYQYFEIYGQAGTTGTAGNLGVEFHVWQCRADPSQQPCSPINRP